MGSLYLNFSVIINENAKQTLFEKKIIMKMKSDFATLLILLPLFLSSFYLNAQNTLPSCVITFPHVNAYFEKGGDIIINVYASDLGGSFTGGSVTKVEFFADGIKLGESETPFSNTYSWLWSEVPEGNYRITAKATDNDNASFTSAGVIITVGTSGINSIGLSSNKGKYLANIIGNNVKSNFNSYWNGVTAENSCKWGSVEGSRDVMNWTTADRAYQHAKDNYMSFRYHALAWGSQYPSWITNLDPAEFQEEMEEYMAAIAERYPLIDQIDVLNENMYLNTWNGEEHAAGSPYFRAGLGGPGETGYDWAIWLFEKARFYFPDSKLVINDFELETNSAGRNEILELVKVLRDRGLIDGFGTQAHYFNVDGISAANLENALNSMAGSGVPVYVTELDLKGSPASETNQLNSYKIAFPVYWNHPAVAGITLWGYVDGSTWSEGTGILNSNGTERSAMEWLKSYMNGLQDVGYPFADLGELAERFIVQAEDFDGESGIEVDICSEGGSAVTGINNNDYCFYLLEFDTGYNSIDFRIAAEFQEGRPQGSIEIRTDSINGQLLGTLEVLGTGGLTSWQTFTCPVEKVTGPQSLYLIFKRGGYEINWFELKNDLTQNDSPIVFGDFSLYPNPVRDGKLYVRSKSDQILTGIEIFNLQGMIVHSRFSHSSEIEMDVSSFKSGIYFVRVKTENSVLSGKIIIQ